jgi:hypothetical protein
LHGLVLLSLRRGRTRCVARDLDGIRPPFVKALLPLAALTAQPGVTCSSKRLTDERFAQRRDPAQPRFIRNTATAHRASHDAGKPVFLSAAFNAFSDSFI